MKPKASGPRCPLCGTKLRDLNGGAERAAGCIIPPPRSGWLVCPYGCAPAIPDPRVKLEDREPR